MSLYTRVLHSESTPLNIIHKATLNVALDNCRPCHGNTSSTCVNGICCQAEGLGICYRWGNGPCPPLHAGVHEGAKLCKEVSPTPAVGIASGSDLKRPYPYCRCEGRCSNPISIGDNQFCCEAPGKTDCKDKGKPDNPIGSTCMSPSSQQCEIGHR